MNSAQTMPALIILLVLLSKPSSITPAATYPPIAKPGCNDSCGDVKIPYPFGMTKDCYLNEDFSIDCNYSSDYNTRKPFLSRSPINVTNVTLDGQLHILKFIGHKCYNNSIELEEESFEPSFQGDPFTINGTINKFIVVGCDSYAFAEGRRLSGENYTTGCTSICDNKFDVINGSCSGGGCCKTSIPNGMSGLDLEVRSYHNHSYVQSFNPCTYAFVVEEDKFSFSFDNLTNLYSVQKLPLAMDWSVGYDQNETCETAKNNLTSYACQNNSSCSNGGGGYLGYRCFCKEGYQGNPYLPNTGCQDVDECRNPKTNNCTITDLCKNFDGGYNCSCPDGYNINDDGKGPQGCIPKSRKSNQLLVAWILSGIAIGIATLLVGCSWFQWRIRRRNLILMKEKFFQDNGGLILQQQLNGQEGSSNATKLFGDDELKKATNNFHESQIVGQGGFGIVYKGFLKEINKFVAIKKSKTIDRNQIEQFINEVVVLSQVNHINVVKLLGCCLETEVPLLVYEFINNGTLFRHLHATNNGGRQICWDIRLKIAAETAEALSYLHSAASPPIIHRDVKTPNILLDENYNAKVSDFGASRLGPLDQNQLSTMVQGTHGYLDPEFFQTFQLTEKSDVYSFGVVLVELLTGKKPVCFDRSENEISLSNLFLLSMKENRLFGILDDSVVSDENIEQLKEVAMLAERCLNVKGDDRPSMKAVAMELVGLRSTSKHTWIQGAQAYQEETEPLIHHEKLIASNVGEVMLTSVSYGLENQVIVPIADGR